MKKRLARNCILMAVLTVIMGVALSWYMATTVPVPAADNAVTYTDGTYTSSSSSEVDGYTSTVSVTVTIIGGKVSNVVVDASADSPDYGQKAAETLAAALTAAGSDAGVDAVSGCTVTSENIFAAFDACLAQAAQQ